MAIQTIVIRPPKARFSPGQVVMTVGVDTLIRQGQLNPIAYLHRHLAGDWGELSESDKRQNDAAVRSGQDRILSSYQVIWPETVDYHGRRPQCDYAAVA